MGQAGAFVENDDNGLEVGAKLGGGSAEDVGGLQGTPGLDAPTALPALAGVDVELAVRGPARHLDLVLAGDVGFFHLAAAAEAGGRQGGVVDLVDVVRRRGVTVGPWVSPALRPGVRGCSCGALGGNFIAPVAADVGDVALCDRYRAP